jgi:hypothetical protein
MEISVGQELSGTVEAIAEARSRAAYCPSGTRRDPVGNHWERTDAGSFLPQESRCFDLMIVLLNLLRKLVADDHQRRHWSGPIEGTFIEPSAQCLISYMV